MDITKFDFVSPTKATEVGHIHLGVIMPITYEQVGDDLSDGEISLVLSDDSAALLEQLRESLIKDVKAQS